MLRGRGYHASGGFPVQTNEAIQYRDCGTEATRDTPLTIVNHRVYGASMVWIIAVPFSIGLLVGLLIPGVRFLVVASLVMVLAGFVLTPSAWWPLGGIATIFAMLSSLQGAYLVGLFISFGMSSQIEGSANGYRRPSTVSED